MHSLWQDVRFGLRSFSRTPVAALLSVATLALGIGANAAIFTVVHRVLIAPLPYPGADRVVVPWRHNAQMGGLSVSPALNDLRKWQSLPSVEARASGRVWRWVGVARLLRAPGNSGA